VRDLSNVVKIGRDLPVTTMDGRRHRSFAPSATVRFFVVNAGSPCYRKVAWVLGYTVVAELARFRCGPWLYMRVSH